MAAPYLDYLAAQFPQLRQAIAQAQQPQPTPAINLAAVNQLAQQQQAQARMAALTQMAAQQAQAQMTPAPVVRQPAVQSNTMLAAPIPQTRYGDTAQSAPIAQGPVVAPLDPRISAAAAQVAQQQMAPGVAPPQLALDPLYAKLIENGATPEEALYYVQQQGISNRREQQRQETDRILSEGTGGDPLVSAGQSAVQAGQSATGATYRAAEESVQNPGGVPGRIYENVDKAARVAIGTPFGYVYENVPGAKTVIDLFNKPYEWNVGRVGEAVVDRANGKGEPGISNPSYYVDSGLDTWAADPKNKDIINAVFNEGLDFDEDGKADVTGGLAVYMYYGAVAHPGFIDTLVSALGMDPLFVASFIAPMASSGRIGAQVGADLGTAGGMTKTAAILNAADRALGVVTKTGDVLNKMADLPINITVGMARGAAKAARATPKVGGTLGFWLDRATGPAPETAERAAAEQARGAHNATETATDIPVYGSQAAQPPGPQPQQPKGPVQPGTPPFLHPPGVTSSIDPTPHPTGLYPRALPEQSVTNPPDFTVGPGGQIVRTESGIVPVYDDNLLAIGPGFQGSQADIPPRPRATKDPSPATAEPIPLPEGEVRPLVKDTTFNGLPAKKITNGGEETYRVKTVPGKGYVVDRKIGTKYIQQGNPHPTMEAAEAEAVRLAGGGVTKEVPTNVEPVPEQQALTESPTAAIPELRVLPEEPVERTLPTDGMTDEQRLKAIKDPNNPITELTPRRGDGRFISKVYELGDANPAAWTDFVGKYKPLAAEHLDALNAVDREIAAIDAQIGKLKPGEKRKYLPQEQRDALFVRRAELVQDANVKRIEHTVDSVPLVVDSFRELPDMAPDAARAKINSKSGKASFREESNQYLMQRYVFEEDAKKSAGALEVLRHREGLGNQTWWQKLEARLVAAREKLVALKAKAAEAYGDMQNVGIVPRGVSRFVKRDADAVPSVDDVATERFLADSDTKIQKLRGAIPDEVADYLAQPVRDIKIKKGKEWVNGTAADLEKHSAATQVPVGESFEDAGIRVDQTNMLELMTRVANEMPDATSEQLADAFAKRVLDVTGARRTPRDRMSPAVEIPRGVFAFFRDNAREIALYNPVTGFRGIAGDFVSDNFRMLLEGHGGAAFSWDDYLRRARGQESQLSRKLRSLGEDDLHINVKHGRTEVTVGERTSTHRYANKLTRAKPGSALDKAGGFFSGFINSKNIAHWRNASDNVRREAVALSSILKQEYKLTREFRQRAYAWSEKHGILPTSFDAYFDSIGESPKTGGRLTPGARRWGETDGVRGAEQVREAMRELAHDAGMTGDAAVNFADRLARDWKAVTRKLRNDANAEQKRVLFSYERTNIDDFLGNFIFFHYWMTRAIPAYARIALRNPELMAMWIRTWEDVKRRAEESGYPETLKGYINFMGSPEGWNYGWHPLGMILPIVDMMPDAQSEGWFDTLTNFVVVNPVVKNAAAVLGLSNEIADPLMTYGPRNMLMAGINKIRAHTGRGHVRDPYEWLVRKSVELGNDLASNLPYVNKKLFFDPDSSNVSEIQYNVAQVVAERTGVPVDQWVQGGPEYRMFVEAINDGAAGVDNPIYQEGFERQADAELKGRGLGAAIPGGVVTRYGPRDQDIVGGQEGTLTEQEQQFKAAINSGSPEAATLTVNDQAYRALGTERQRALHDGWTDIAYPEIDANGNVQTQWGLLPANESGVSVGGTWISLRQLAAMEEQDRYDIADLWVREQNGTEEYEQYKAERKDFVAKHPEYAPAQDWAPTIHDEWDDKGGVRAFRENRAKGNPNFKAEMEAQRDFLKDQGITDPKLLEAELDQWALSIAGYMAAQGIRNDVYDPEPKSTGDQATVDAIRVAVAEGGGQTSGKTKAKTTTAKLKEDIAEFERDAAMVDTLLKNYGIDLGPGGLANVHSPYALQSLGGMLGDLMPKRTTLMRQYEEWVVLQPKGADTSPEAFGRYLDQLAEREALDAALNPDASATYDPTAYQFPTGGSYAPGYAPLKSFPAR